MARTPARNDLAALAEAQEVVFDAWDASSKARRIALARKALEISPLCADAYGILAAELADGSAEQIDGWRKAVAAGEAALGPRVFKEDEGHFWLILESRPYMRAKEGLAWALWQAGQPAEAIAHARDMLRLNPNDNQGMRYTLARWLFGSAAWDELDALLKAYEEDSMADWNWTQTLATFRRHGDSPQSLSALKEAMKSNRHAAAYLLGRKKIPKSSPPFYSPGDEDEAIIYAESWTPLWQATEGALAWLAANAGPPSAARSRKRPPRK